MKKQIDEKAKTITFTFDRLEPVVFDPAKANEANNEYARLHGYMARIGDAAALSRKGPDGTILTITEAMRREAVLELVTHYESGADTWNLAGRTRSAPQNPTILAIAAKMGKTYAEAEAYIQEKMLAELGE